MDIASRLHTRARAHSHRHPNPEAAPPDDSSGDSDAQAVRRKFQRTAHDPNAPDTNPAGTNNDSTFRKPSIPASANRTNGNESRPAPGGRRKSTLRENVRVPSGPRGFPSPTKPKFGSDGPKAPPMTDATNTNRPSLPQTSSEPHFSATRRTPRDRDPVRLSFGQSNSSTDGNDSPSHSGGFFLPDINFDDFQTSISGHDRASPLIHEFPTVGGARVLSKEMDATGTGGQVGNDGRAKVLGTIRPQQRQPSPQRRDGVGRTHSLRERLAAGRQASATQQSAPRSAGPPQDEQPQQQSQQQGNTNSWRARRPSSVFQSSAVPAPAPPPTHQSSRAPRKSVGPGVLTSLVKGSNDQQTPALPPDPQPGVTRTHSLSKGRRTTLLPSASSGAQQIRASTIVPSAKSVRKDDGDLDLDLEAPNAPWVSKQAPRNHSSDHQNGPSSGNRRQSMASGRASGLGARTISPTDARRLKRMSMMPVPTPNDLSKAPPTPSEERPTTNHSHRQLPELPRVAQPSPSSIPRKTSSSTPNSGRASPDGKGLAAPSGLGLHTKPSYSSLTNNAPGGSRLPTPRARVTSQYGAPLAQYGEQHRENDSDELVPPVPAIPKGFGSPRDDKFSHVLPASKRSPHPDFPDSPVVDGETVHLSAGVPSQPTRNSVDTAAPTTRPRKSSLEQAKAEQHRISAHNPSSNPPRSIKTQHELNGRKNANLQPLRLPPMNLLPLNTRSQQSADAARTSHHEDGDPPQPAQTPEPKRTVKTPSTPMTASKATFFKRQEETNKALRSSSSHFALRDVLGVDADGNMITKYWDENSEAEKKGVSIPTTQHSKHRGAITPFSSGSLPKGSGEFMKLRGRPSGEYEDQQRPDIYDGWNQQSNARSQGPRARAQTGASSKVPGSADAAENGDSPNDEYASPNGRKEGDKKEQSGGGGLRRKLSLGWRRGGSKNAHHADNKNSPQQEEFDENKGKERTRLQKKNAEMPPPKLPASATWSGEVPNLPSAARTSVDNGHSRRKSQLPASLSIGRVTSNADGDGEQATANKTRNLHSEQPTAVTSRSTSWNHQGPTTRSKTAIANANQVRHKFTPSTISVLKKDKDDHIADDEMHRLSRKRKDVDAAARETEELKKRALSRSPVTAEHASRDRSLTGGAALNVFERGEIVDYDRDGIYFTGTSKAKKIIGALSPSPSLGSIDISKGGNNNFGYDDERGDYNIVLGDHLAYRYEVIDVLGKGSFGQVVRCIDHKDGGMVAIKIIRNKKRFHQQALVEVGILGKLRDWDPDGSHATLSITSSFYFRSHLCIVTPALSINLYELIRAHNFVGFNLPLIRRFSRQLLACLTLLQQKRIIHCDLKPENILLCEARKADVRVIDFGSSCKEEEKVYTYIQSRFYRSPEVILGSNYGLGIDMWSFGCILAELWTGYPIFPGENEQEQLACIMEIFGPPDRHLVERCTRKKLFFDSVGKPRVTVSSKGRRRRPSSKTLQQALKTDDEAFVDFLSRCLRWDPDRRMKPAEALSHPFVRNEPMNAVTRKGIPDEARVKPTSATGARVRSAANPTAAPTATTNGAKVPASPTKRATTTSSATSSAYIPPQPHLSTPSAGPRTRALPDTPQTAVRSGGPTIAAVSGHGSSPVKPSQQSQPKPVTSRRVSAMPPQASNPTGAGGGAGSAGTGNVKRVSKDTQMTVGGPGSGQAAHMGQGRGRVESGSSTGLAQLAARESMFGGPMGGGGGRGRGG